MASCFHVAAVLLLLAECSCAVVLTNSWAVQVLGEGGGRGEAADALASKYGFVNLGLVRKLSAKCNIVCMIDYEVV